jgi:AraC-like DNA-binding protein
VQRLDSLSKLRVGGQSTELARDISPGPGTRVTRFTPEADGAPSSHIRRICAFIRTHYAEPISLQVAAGLAGRNATYIATMFRRQTGMTIHRYQIRVRMRRAATLLRQSEKVEAVMLLVGYRCKKNFYRQFEMTFGVTPGQYKTRHIGRRRRAALAQAVD